MKHDNTVSERLVKAARRLGRAVDKLKFSPPVAHVYNPLQYAWSAHEIYLRRFGNGRKNVVFLGMNPGPFGMVQTGVPFGEVSAVRDWLGITCEIKIPRNQHPKRLVTGFACPRSEVSGQRLWGLFANRFKACESFFESHLVLNYCPLAFVEESGRNRTPDKLLPEERRLLFAACDDHLAAALDALRPEWIIGIGDFATRRALEAGAERDVKVGQVLHPSPASPLANRGWDKVVTKQLQELGVWKKAN
jgi:single-strand selective monofunctional uracil DNA glycosylase